MAYWLLKTEPSSYSWDDLIRDRRTVWDGIRNPLALKYLRSSTRGDQAIIYHTGRERRAMGIAKIVKGAYPDPDLQQVKRPVVNITVVKPMKKPVTLVQIKADPAFVDWVLLRISRLSFVPVPAPMWRHLMTLSGTR